MRSHVIKNSKVESMTIATQQRFTTLPNNQSIVVEVTDDECDKVGLIFVECLENEIEKVDEAFGRETFIVFKC